MIGGGLIFLLATQIDHGAAAAGSVRPAEGIGAEMDRLIEASVEMSHFMGAALVARGGKVLLRKGYGMADVEKGIPNSPSTRFYIASLTKPFTAVAIFQLHERGVLRLDSPVSAYLPGWPRRFKGVTVRHLLTHASGIPDEPFPWRCTGAELLRWLSTAAPDFPPGQRLLYSNDGFLILGMIIENVSGMPYDEYLRKNIFSPLGMERTGVGRGARPPRGSAVGYRLRDGGHGLDISEADPLCPNNSAGGIFSTIDDLYRFNQGLDSGALLQDETMRRMLEPVKGEESASGWRVGSRFGLRYAEHGGDMPGYDSYMSRYPGDKACVIVLANIEGGESHTLASGLSTVLLTSSQPSK